MFRNKRILVTGGTGSIGSEIVRKLLKYKPKEIIVYARDDSKLFFSKQKLANDIITFVVGDIREKNSLKRQFLKNIDIVIHAAALKHVSFCEEYPYEATLTNIMGTQNLIDLSNEFSVEAMIAVSTDKAANPLSAMGATKYLAEKLMISSNSNSTTKFSCVRFGNVLGSRGSVIPAFFNAIKTRNEITVTNLDVTRFIMPISDAADWVLDSLCLSKGGEIFVMKMRVMKLKDLVDAFKQIFVDKEQFNVNIIGLLDGEKLHEELVMSNEVDRIWETPNLFIIGPKSTDWSPLSKSNASKCNLNFYTSSEGDFFTSRELKKIIEELHISMD